MSLLDWLNGYAAGWCAASGGHGGMVAAMRRSAMFDAWERRGFWLSDLAGGYAAAGLEAAPRRDAWCALRRMWARQFNKHEEPTYAGR